MQTLGRQLAGTQLGMVLQLLGHARAPQGRHRPP
jgi:hypothetical protein